MLAGRSAMVGFAVAFCSELILPHEGLFGAWGSQAQTFAATALLLTTSAAVSSCLFRLRWLCIHSWQQLLFTHVQILATMSKRRLGMHFQKAVLTSLTALSRSASSITHRNVDSAVDYVFEQVSLSGRLCWKPGRRDPQYELQFCALQVFGTSFVDGSGGQSA